MSYLCTVLHTIINVLSLILSHVKIKNIIVCSAFAAAAAFAVAKDNIVEEVAWTIGDDPIYKSEIEQTYQDMLQERATLKGDPYCSVPEMIAIQRLYLHQADLDTVVVSDSQIQSQVDGQVNFLISNLGTREKS